MHDDFQLEIIEEDDEIDTPGPFSINCAFCSGTGVHPATMKSLAHEHCPICQGTGMLEVPVSRKDTSNCNQCGGNGKEINAESIQPCRLCGGYGILQSAIS